MSTFRRLCQAIFRIHILSYFCKHPEAYQYFYRSQGFKFGDVAYPIKVIWVFIIKNHNFPQIFILILNKFEKKILSKKLK